MGAEGEIRKQLADLQELVSYQAGEGNLSSLTNAKRLGELFTEDVEIKLSGFAGARQVRGREQVQQAAMAARSQARSLQASLHDISIRVADDKMSATVEATGRAKIAGESSSAVQDFIFYFEKTPEGWLITKVETVKALR